MWTAIVASLLILLCGLLGQVVAAAVATVISGKPFDAASAVTPEMMIAVAAANFAVFVSLSALWGALGREPSAIRLGFNGPTKQRVSPAFIVALTAAVLFGGNLVELVAVMLGASSESLGAINAAVRGASWPQFAALLVFIGVGAGIGEELVFRGILQTRLSERWSAVASIGFTSVLFGAIHADPVHSVAAAVMGAILGYGRWASGDVRAGIFAHAINNVLATVLSRAGFDNWSMPVGWMIPASAVSFAAALFALSRLPRAGLAPAPPPITPDAAVGGAS